jgi:radical SAM protein with 4Fe4S-binding SPASM domain
MSLDVFKKILTNIQTSGVYDVYLIGGEPSVHPEFEKFLAELKKYTWETIGICTNGIAYSKEQMRNIAKIFDYISVSVRGTKKTTNYITGNKNSYSNTMKFLQFLSKRKKPIIRIALDLIPAYLDEFEDILKLFIENGFRCEYIDLHRIAPIGSAKKEFSLSLEQYQMLLTKIDKVAKELPETTISFEDGLPLCLFDKRYWKYINHCQCGFSKVWIDPYGKVRRCACSSGAVADALHNPMNEIWNSSILKRFRSFTWLPEACKNCSVFSKCYGGCSSSRGVKYFETDVFSEKFVSIK